MQGKTVLITGGNCGIGLATAGQLARKGARVVITSRDRARGQAAQAEIEQTYGASVELLELDLSSFDSIRACAAAFDEVHDALHVLVNNAGLSLSDRQQTREGFEYLMGVHYVGHALLTQLLLPKLKASAPARVVNLSSAAHFGARKGMHWDDLQRTARYGGAAYTESKLAVIYYTKEFARRHADDGITSFAVNPGFVTTRFGKDGDSTGIGRLFWKLGDYWMADADKGARTSVYAACDPDVVKHSGAYLDKSRVAKPSSWAVDQGAAKRMWELGERWLADGHP